MSVSQLPSQEARLPIGRGPVKMSSLDPKTVDLDRRIGNVESDRLAYVILYPNNLGSGSSQIEIGGFKANGSLLGRRFLATFWITDSSGDPTITATEASNGFTDFEKGGLLSESVTGKKIEVWSDENGEIQFYANHSSPRTAYCWVAVGDRMLEGLNSIEWQ